MIKLLTAYASTAVAFVILDAGWLGLVGPKLYRPIREALLSGQVRLAPAIIFYVVYIAGLTWLVVRPALSAERWQDALLGGAIFGLVAYGTYALTNHAVMKVWTPAITVGDMAWGAVASSAATLIGYLVARAVTK